MVESACMAVMGVRFLGVDYGLDFVVFVPGGVAGTTPPSYKDGKFESRICSLEWRDASAARVQDNAPSLLGGPCKGTCPQEMLTPRGCWLAGLDRGLGSGDAWGGTEHLAAASINDSKRRTPHHQIPTLLRTVAPQLVA